jgi:hypothetical protein
MENNIKILTAVILFFIISMPCSYFLTNKVFKFILNKNKCPTYSGIIVHTCVFFILYYITLHYIIKKKI